MPLTSLLPNGIAVVARISHRKASKELELLGLESHIVGLILS